MLRLSMLATSLLVYSLLFSSKSFAEPNQKIENEKTVLKTTLSYLNGKAKFDEALEYTKKFLKKHPNEPEVLRLQGLEYYSKQDFKKAAAEFLLASQFTIGEEKAVNLYLAAQSEIKNGDLSGANRQLLEMKKISSASKYADVAIAQLESEKSIPEFNLSLLENEANTKSKKEKEKAQKKSQQAKDKKPYSFSLELVSGLDTNPIFLPDNSQSKNEAKSIFYSSSAGATYSSSFLKGEMINAFSLGYTGYQKEAAKSFNNLKVSLATNWKPVYSFFRDNNLSLTNKIDQSYGAQNTLEYFYTSEGISLKKEFAPLGDHKFTTTLATSYRFYANKNLDAPENNRAGYTLSIGGTHKLARNNWIWSNSLGASKLTTVGKKFNTWDLSFVTNYQRIIFSNTELLLGANYGMVNYPNSGGRVDKSLGLEVDLTREVNLINGLSTKLSASRTKNTSDLEDSNYTQDIYALWIMYDFN